MASQCPKCHEVLEEDAICCAGIEFQWKCTGCQKRTRGFAIPFGQCPLCGGELARIEEEGPSPEKLLILQEAFQIEVSSLHFYRRLAQAVDDPEVSDFFLSFAEKEKEHADELSLKYHIHPEEGAFRDNGKPLPYPFFEDLCFFADTGDVSRLYDCAVFLEKKTLAFFEKKAAALPAGGLKNLCLELAAEEREHVAILESEKECLRSVNY